MSNPNVLLSTNRNVKRFVHNDQHWYIYHMKLLQNVNRNLKVRKFKHVGMMLQMYKYTSSASPCKLYNILVTMDGSKMERVMVQLVKFWNQRPSTLAMIFGLLSYFTFDFLKGKDTLVQT
jgi:hypothetical protein